MNNLSDSREHPEYIESAKKTSGGPGTAPQVAADLTVLPRWWGKGQPYQGIWDQTPSRVQGQGEDPSGRLAGVKSLANRDLTTELSETE